MQQNPFHNLKMPGGLGADEIEQQMLSAMTEATNEVNKKAIDACMKAYSPFLFAQGRASYLPYLGGKDMLDGDVMVFWMPTGEPIGMLRPPQMEDPLKVTVEYALPTRADRLYFAEHPQDGITPLHLTE